MSGLEDSVTLPDDWQSERQPRHGKNHIRFIKKLILGEYYVLKTSKGKSPSKPMKLLRVIGKEQAEFEEGQRVSLADFGVVRYRGTNNFNAQNWIETADAPEEQKEA